MSTSYDQGDTPGPSYNQALAIASDLIESPDDNPEYSRGCVELLADMFGIPGVELGDRKEEVEADMLRYREDQLAEADRQQRPYVVGLVAEPGVIERFPTHGEAVAWMAENLNIDTVRSGAYYIDGPEEARS